MSQKKALPIALLIVGFSTLLVFWVTLGDERPRGSSASVAATPSAPASDTPLAPMPTTVNPVAPVPLTVGVAREEVAEPPAAPEEPDWMDGGEQWLEGRVSLAPGTPRDELLHVFAVAQRSAAAELYDKDGPGARVGQSDAQPGKSLVSMAAVDAAGGFRLALPAATGVAHLALAGRYTYSHSTTEVALPATEPPVLAGELGAWLTGRLVPAGGDSASVADVEVELGTDISGNFDAFAVGRQSWEIEGRTDAQGRFEFRAISPAVRHGMLVRPETFAALVQLGIEVEPGQHLEREWMLSAGATVRGRVVDQAGTAVAGVEIEASLPGIAGMAMGTVRRATSDASGAFELPHVTIGKIELKAELEGYATTRHKLEQPLADGDVQENVELVLGRGRVLAGTVRFPDGSAAAEVKVDAGPDLAKVGQMGGITLATAGRGSAQTDAEGRFEIAGLSEMAYKLVARKSIEGGERAGEWKAVADNVEGTEPLTLVLEGLIPLSGRVVDRAGQPVQHFTLSAKQAGGGAAAFFASFDRRQESFDDEQGRFEMKDLEAGTWEVLFDAEGFASTKLADLVLPRPPEAEELVITLEPAAAVEGLVLDTAGKPASGALVTLELDLGQRMEQQAGGGVPSAHADHEGRFRLELDPGEHALVASLTGFAESEVVRCKTTSGELTEGVVLTLRLGGTLTGLVLNDEGEPNPGRMVIVQRSPSFSAQKMMTTEADGSFRIEHLEPGSWQVVATVNFMAGEGEDLEGEGMNDFLGSMKIDFVDIVDGEETHVVLGEPAASPVRLHGRVVAAGEPLTGALVSAMPEDGNGLKDLKMKTLGEDGSFEMDLPKPGNYLLTVQINAAAGQQQNTELLETIPEGVTEHTLVIEMPLGRIAGRVKGHDGSPLANCRVTLNSEGASYGTVMGGHFVEASTDAEGRYEILHLRPGTYSVGAGGLGFGGLFGGEAAAGRLVKGGLRLDEGDALEDVDFRLEQPGNLTGSVLDAAGLPVPDAVIFVRDEDGELLEHFSLVASDSSGRFTYKGLSPGRYTVSARAKDAVAPESELVRVVSGESAEISLRMTTGVMLVITVIDKDEQELGTRLSVIDAAGREYGSMRSMDELMERMGAKFTGKEQRVGPVPPGTYELVATADDGRTTSKQVTISDQGERRIKLRLK